MPKCDRCRRGVSSADLAPMPSAINVLACPACRETAPHMKTGRKPAKRRPQKEDRMDKDCNTNEKRLFNFSVAEVQKKDGKDYRFDLNFVHAGLDIKFGWSMDEVRDFLSKRKAAREEKAAQQG